jgi:hypothetical protein
MLYEMANGRIVGRYAQPQEGKTLLQETNNAVKAALAQEAAEAQALADAEAAYAYARGRKAEYVAAFSKAPKPDPIDAIGHFCDRVMTILTEIAPTNPNVIALASEISAIKARHPK